MSIVTLFSVTIYQSGFRSHHSCTIALLHVTDDLLKTTDEGKLSILVLLDYSKAFDIVNQSLSLSILRYNGYSERVKVDNIILDSIKINCGAPQGSILGLLLFSIFTCNLFDSVRYWKVHLYATDTQLYYSFPSDEIYSVVQ